MPLDPQAERLLAQWAEAGIKPLAELTPREARDQMLLGSRFVASPEPVHSTRDLQIPGPGGPLPIRIYRPSDAAPLPALVYLHGGGWLSGSIETHDCLCRSLCRQAEIAVVSVDYRLAPEHRFPAAVEDAYAAGCWAAEQGPEFGLDPQRLAVGGDSAGGNLAAAVALLARERGGPVLRYQLLIYPVLDHCFDTASYHENASGYHLTRDDMVCAWRRYLAREADADSPLASPLREPDLSDLPAALVVTAEYDPLRDEGEHYARRLVEAGVPAVCRRYDGLIHGFVRRTNQFDRAREAVAEISAALKTALHGGTSQ